MVSRIAGVHAALPYNGEPLELPAALFILSQWNLVLPYYCAMSRWALFLWCALW